MPAGWPTPSSNWQVSWRMNAIVPNLLPLPPGCVPKLTARPGCVREITDGITKALETGAGGARGTALIQQAFALLGLLPL